MGLLHARVASGDCVRLSSCAVRLERLPRIASSNRLKGTLVRLQNTSESCPCVDYVWCVCVPVRFGSRAHGTCDAFRCDICPHPVSHAERDVVQSRAQHRFSPRRMQGKVALTALRKSPRSVPTLRRVMARPLKIIFLIRLVEARANKNNRATIVRV